MKHDLVHVRRVGMRWGAATEAANQAKQALYRIRHIRDLLPSALLSRVDHLGHELLQLEMDLLQEEIDTLPKNAKRSKRSTCHRPAEHGEGCTCDPRRRRR